MNKSFQNRPFIGLSHRGNSKEFIENSLEAFKSVAKKGYKYIETDLRLTLDGHVVTFHDEDLKRLFPKRYWNKLHLQIIYYGREFCKARDCYGITCKICTSCYPNRKKPVETKKA